MLMASQLQTFNYDGNSAYGGVSTVWKVSIILTTLLLLTACARPSHNQTKLHEIRMEARMLIANSPRKGPSIIPRGKWPRAIASLHPERGAVLTDGVDILVRPYFDGGWGYFFPSNERDIPEPVGRFARIDQGVYWYQPY
jgi:hypothetical protein